MRAFFLCVDNFMSEIEKCKEEQQDQHSNDSKSCQERNVITRTEDNLIQQSGTPKQPNYCIWNCPAHAS